MIIDVMDLKLDVIDFLKPLESSRLERARNIHLLKRVSIKKVEQKDEDIFVEASVEGSNWQQYKTELQLKGNKAKDYYCSCKDFEKGHICKHLLATSLEVIEPHEATTQEGKAKLREKQLKEEEERKRMFLEQLKQEQERYEYQRKYSTALLTINRFKKDREIYSEDVKLNTKADLKNLYEETKIRKNLYSQSTPELSTEIKLEPKIILEQEKNSMKINFKIGGTKMYILKDIQGFCHAFAKGEQISYGKNLKFIAKEENFAENSKQLLKFILDYGDLLKYNEKLQENNYYYSMDLSGKNLYAIDKKIDDFFEIIKNTTISVSRYNMDPENYTLTDKNLEIFAKIEKENDEYEIKINLKNYNYVKTNENIYIFYNNEIYKKQNTQLGKLLELFEYEKQILVPSDKIEEFSEYVFPEIIDYIQTDNLSSQIVKEGILVDKLASKVYLDLDEKDNITLELKFCYNDYEFNILDSNYGQYIKEHNIVRNIPEETKVLRRLFMDGFEMITNKRYFTLKNEEETYQFLSEKVMQYMNDFEVLVTDKFKNKKVKSPKISNISVKLDNGLLELDISKINIDIDEIKNILKNYNVKKKYYKLKNGDFLNLEKNEDIEFLNDIQNTFDINYDKFTGVIKAPVSRSVYLEKMLEKNKNINTTKNDNFTKLINNIENKNFSEDIKIENDFENILRDYQKVGYKWLKILESYKLGGVLADDMGLGKTLQVIALIQSSKQNKKPSIVVCPSSLVLNWKAETEKWAKNMKVLVIKGDAQTRKELINSYKNYDLIITSYDTLKRDVFEYDNKEFKYIIADEAQYIKNFATQNATALKNLMGETKFALTGTPIENSISELWSIFDFIMPRIFI